VTLAGAGLVGAGTAGALLRGDGDALGAVRAVRTGPCRTTSTPPGFFTPGVFSSGFFAVAISARLLARRVIANEALARQRGVDLNNQTVISQRVIEEMQDGVLVLRPRRSGQPEQPVRAPVAGRRMAAARSFERCSPELAQGFS
jgi:two-component system sensor histidine kinase PilS (NtrC family)